MKNKIILLSLLFLSTGLFSSSKENSKISKGECILNNMEKALIVEGKSLSNAAGEISPENLFLFVAIKPI